MLFRTHFERPIKATTRTLSVLATVAAVATLVALTVYIGYNLSPADRRLIAKLLRASQGIFLAHVIADALFGRRGSVRNKRAIKWLVNGALVLSVFPWAFPRPAHPWLPWLVNILYSPRYELCVLGAYSLVHLSSIFSQIPGRRTNPSLLMAGSFLVFIIIGSFALMLPRCTHHGISFSDSLFLASSAVCITGLSPVDIPSTFTPLGLIVLSVLVQLGSLGLITFTSFFALFFTGNTSIYNQLLLRDIIYSKSMNSLVPTLLYVLGFTITIELIGAVAVYFTIPAELGLDLGGKLTFAGFHAMSAFCNAGFSCVPGGMANEAFMRSNQAIYLVTSVLIFAGAVGFPILVNLREILFFHVGKLWRRITGKRESNMRLHIFDLNTKLVLVTTTIILAVSTAAFFALEYNNTLAGMSLYQKGVQSLFNSLIPRSAGFATVNPAAFMNVTLLLILVQMFIGGSSQSMAGGIKVNTFGTILLSLRATIKGDERTSAFSRAVNPLSVRRAYAVATLAVGSLAAYIITLFLLEPGLPAKALVFEAVSALFTVGSSLGITADLCVASKILLCTAMFLGRVGMLSILSGVMARKHDITPHLPIDNIIIN